MIRLALITALTLTAITAEAQNYYQPPARPLPSVPSAPGQPWWVPQTLPPGSPSLMIPNPPAPPPPPVQPFHPAIGAPRGP
jgi:hypothetical protein